MYGLKIINESQYVFLLNDLKLMDEPFSINDSICMNKWMNEWINEWMNAWMNEQMKWKRTVTL